MHAVTGFHPNVPTRPGSLRRVALAIGRGPRDHGAVAARRARKGLRHAIPCGALAAASLACAAPAVLAAPAPLINAGAKDTIPGRYVVVLRGEPGTAQANVAARAVDRARARGVRPDRTYKDALNGFASQLTPAQLDAVRNDPDVELVAADATVRISDVQRPATWGLDRLDQVHLPLDNTYRFTGTGAGVTAYVIDTGIRTTHTEFGGRAVSGVDMVDGGTADDCHGHGTHVAGTIGGVTYGVAKKVKLVAVRVLDCGGSGTFAGVIAGVDWVTGNHQSSAPAVANMSLGGGAYPPLDAAVTNSINDGVTYAVAAGNDGGGDACNRSPARTPKALTVGATSRTDHRAAFSNVGSCLDLFAPGEDITSAWITSNTATASLSGTSMASPHVAGAAAVYLQRDPTALPSVVSSWIVDTATTGKVVDARAGSPNRLLNVIDDDPQTTVARRPNGKIDVFMRADDGNASIATLDTTGRLIMPWTSLGKQVLGAPSGTWSADGKTLDVFAIGTDYRIHRRRYSSSSGWNAWNEAPGGGVATSGTVGTARNAGGVTIFVRGVSGEAYYERFASSGALVHSWRAMEKRVAGAPVGSWTSDGVRLNVFAVTANHQLWVRRYVGYWGAWRQVPGVVSYSRTVGLAERGTSVHVLLRGPDDGSYKYGLSPVAVLLSAQNLGKQVTAAPAGSWSPDRTTLDIVGIGGDRQVARRRWLDGRGWERWTNSPVASAGVGVAGRISSPGAPDVEHLLSVGNDGKGYRTGISLAGGYTIPWSPIGLARRVLDASGGSWDATGNILDMVAVGDDRVLYRRQYNRGTAWGPWAPLPGGSPATSTSPSVSGYASGVTTAIRGLDGQVYFQTITRSGLLITPWTLLGGPVVGAPAASWSRDGNTLDIAGVGLDRRVYRRQFRRGVGWTGWIVVPGNGRSDGGVTIARRPNGNMTLFARGSSTREALMVELSPSGAVVKDWRSLGSKLLGTPSAYWTADGSTLDVYIVGDDYNVWRRRGFSGGGMLAWKKIGAAGYAPLFATPTAVAGGAPPALAGAESSLALAGTSRVRAADAKAIRASAMAAASDPPPPPSGSLPPL